MLNHLCDVFPVFQVRMSASLRNKVHFYGHDYLSGLVSADLNPQSYESDRNRNLGKLIELHKLAFYFGKNFRSLLNYENSGKKY